MTTVLLVDDHELIRHGLRRAFERDPDFEVVGEASSVAEALAVIRATAPEVVIMDVRLPDGNGLDAVKKLRAAGETMGIVILTMYAGDDQLFGALEAGASSFVNKDAPAEEVLAAARHAAASPASFSAADLADAMRRKMTPSGPALSPREKEVLKLLYDGLAVSGIAKKLFISESTTKTHISKVYEKLGAANRVQAVRAALDMGLITSERQSPR
ncbi:MAG TPA: response regulator transcription factor [Sporichthyaceae bacterium]|jgi:DNA-binding NarL/FixJ family response regulator|nr:response regulator transcription factor [Sporichthyaceae bacterium]